jgi:hypothetical protein
VIFPKVADLIFPIRKAALSRKPYLSRIPITGNEIINIDIYLFSTNAFPNVVMMELKDIPETSPVIIPAATTTAMVSSFIINPTIMIKIPISFIIYNPPFVFFVD